MEVVIGIVVICVTITACIVGGVAGVAWVVHNYPSLFDN